MVSDFCCEVFFGTTLEWEGGKVAGVILNHHSEENSLMLSFMYLNSLMVQKKLWY